MAATTLTTCTQSDLTIPLPANWLTDVLTYVLRGARVKEAVLLVKPAEDHRSVR